MKIYYYIVNEYGCILEKSVDTNDADYVCHTNDDVTIVHKDFIPYAKSEKLTFSRNFDKVKRERIDEMQKYIDSLQIEIDKTKLHLNIFERSVDYKNYETLQYIDENRKLKC